MSLLMAVRARVRATYLKLICFLRLFPLEYKLKYCRYHIITYVHERAFLGCFYSSQVLHIMYLLQQFTMVVKKRLTLPLCRRKCYGKSMH